MGITTTMPRKPDDARTVPRNFRLRPEVFQAICELAERWACSRAEVIARVVLRARELDDWPVKDD